MTLRHRSFVPYVFEPFQYGFPAACLSPVRQHCCEPGSAGSVWVPVARHLNAVIPRPLYLLEHAVEFRPVGLPADFQMRYLDRNFRTSSYLNRLEDRFEHRVALTSYVARVNTVRPFQRTRALGKLSRVGIHPWRIDQAGTETDGTFPHTLLYKSAHSSKLFARCSTFIRTDHQQPYVSVANE
jgi:hypothetical protein